MRILSQDIPMIDAFDIPYEMSMLSMSKYMAGRYRIYAQGTFIGNTSDDNFVLMAEYSTEEKARKAMEMLRVSFENYDWIKSTGNSEELKQVARMFNRDEFKKMTSSYFQFPTDDEVEV